MSSQIGFVFLIPCQTSYGLVGRGSRFSLKAEQSRVVARVDKIDLKIARLERSRSLEELVERARWRAERRAAGRRIAMCNAEAAKQRRLAAEKAVKRAPVARKSSRGPSCAGLEKLRTPFPLRRSFLRDEGLDGKVFGPWVGTTFEEALELASSISPASLVRFDGLGRGGLRFWTLTSVAPCYSWALSTKKKNQEMHALNGNISFTSVLGHMLRWAVGQTGRTYETSFEVEGGLRATLTAFLSETGEKKSYEVFDFVDFDTLDELAVEQMEGNWEQVSPFLKPCDMCKPDGPVCGYRFEHPDIHRNSLDAEMYDRWAYHLVLLAYCLPWICQHHYEADFIRLCSYRPYTNWGLIPEVNVANQIPRQFTPVLVDCGCTPEEYREWGQVEPNFDEFGPSTYPDIMYNKQYVSEGWRCAKHGSETNQWKGAAAASMFRDLEMGCEEFSQFLASIVHMRNKYELETDRPSQVTVTGESHTLGYVVDEDAARPTDHLFVFTKVSARIDGAIFLGQRGDAYTHYTTCSYVNNLHFAALRLFGLLAFPVGTVVFIQNGKTSGNCKILRDGWIDHCRFVQHQNGIIGHPGCDALRVVVGYHDIFKHVPLENIGFLAHMYGADELFTSTTPCLTVFTDLTHAGQNVEWICDRADAKRLRYATLKGDGCGKVWKGHITRANYQLVLASLPELITKGLAPSFDEPGIYYEVESNSYSIAHELWELGELGRVSSDQVIVFFMWGTTGDVVPPKAIARYLASVGFSVVYQIATTAEEGKFMLSGAETRITPRHVRLLGELAARVASIPFLTFTPQYTFTGDIATSIQPPEWAIRRPEVGLGPLGDFVVALLLGAFPVMRIASYDDVDCVPRSTNGVDFDVYTPGGQRTVKALYAPGSTSVRYNIPGAQTIEPGDHVAQFRNAEVAYVTGAGTAMTAAACGCRVVALSGKVDRNFIDRLNAGKGMVFEVHPSRALWHVIEARPELFFPLFAKMPISIKLFGVRFFLVRHMPAISFLLFFLFLHIFALRRQFVFSSDWTSTLISSVLFNSVNFFTVLSSTLAARVLELTLRTLNIRLSVVVGRVVAFMGQQAATLPFVFVYVTFRPPVALAAIYSYFLTRIGSYVFNTLMLLASQDDATVFVEFEFLFHGWLPVVHTRLTDADRTWMGEGWFVGTPGFGADYQFRKTAYLRRHPDRWCFMLPTALRESDLEEKEFLTSAYSMVNNCQTQLFHVVGGSTLLFGVAFFLFVPALLWMSFVYIVLMAIVFIGLLILPILRATVLPNERDPAIAGVERHLTRVLYLALESSLPLVSRFYLCVVTAFHQWAAVDPHDPGVLEMMHQAHQEVDQYRPDRTVLVQARVARATSVIVSRGIVDSYLRFMDAIRPHLRTNDRIDPEDRLVLFYEWLEPRDHPSQEEYAFLESRFTSPDDAIDMPEPPSQADVVMFLVSCVLADHEFSDEGDFPSFNAALRYGFGAYNYGEVDEEGFADICAAADELTDVEKALLAFFFFDMPEPSVEGVELEEVPSEQIDGAAALVANLYKAGAEFEDAVEAAARELAAYEHVNSPGAIGLDASITAFNDYMGVRDTIRDNYDGFFNWLFWVRNVAISNNILPYAPIEFVTLLAARATGDITKVVSLLAAPILQAYESATLDPGVRTRFGVLIASFLDIIDQRHRFSPKPAWALLLGKMKFRLSRGDYMMASLPGTTYTPPRDYPEWANTMKDLMSGAKDVDPSKLWSKAPKRALNMPSHTYGIKEYEKLIEYFEVNIDETDRERAMLEKAISHGGRPAMDQAWLSTPDKLELSLSRYLVERPEPSVAAHSKIIEAADSLFDDFPEMYDQPKGMTVDNVIAATEWKFSAGLPFLPVIKKRSELRSSSWIHAIRLAAGRIISQGKFPGIAFHCFPKAQLVALDKLQAGKPIRTVTAGDRITAIAYNVLAMERNKRVPPLRALVLPSFARTEGGMQEVYRELAKHPNYFTGDGTQFDSTVTSSLVVEGPVRLWERGIAGNWGDRATTSFMRAYYQALSDGILVSLIDGKVMRKTGGGGTGSAATSVDNRDWVRIALRASWSLATGKPCSDFKKHVTLANASDDIAFSCDDFTAERLNLWKEVMKVEYGVLFDFQDVQYLDGILHLQVLPEDQIDHDMYAEVNIQQHTISVRHDPERLFTMRSEYRSDRMKKTFLVDFDYISTRSIGHAYLTAHQREAYSDIAMDWVDATSSMLLAFFQQVEVEYAHDDNGNILAATILITDPAPADRIKRLTAKWIPSDREAWFEHKALVMKRWLRAHQLPSYKKVFATWVQVPTESAIAKRYVRLPKASVPIPALDVFRVGLIKVIEGLRFVPKALKDMGGELDVLPINPRFTITDLTVERFIYWKACDRLGRAPTIGEMNALVRQSPYGAACDIYAFNLLRQDPREVIRLNSASEGEKALVFIKVLVAQIIYTFSDVLLRRVAQTRVVGTFIIACFFFIREVDSLYSVLSLVYWLGHGQASLSISSLVARDPYLVLKYFALACITSVPVSMALPGWIWRHSDAIAYPVDVIVSVVKARTLVSEVIQKALVTPPTPFDTVAQQVARGGFDRRAFRVDAPMGTGKSTIFPAALLATGSIRRVVLLLPTNLLVSEYSNDFVAEHHIVRVHAGDSIDDVPKSGLIVMTAGLFASLVAGIGNLHEEGALAEWSDLKLTSWDVVLLDEAGLGTTEQLICLACLKESGTHSPFGLMSGTPTGRLYPGATGRHFTLPPRETQFVRERRDFESGSSDWASAVQQGLNLPIGGRRMFSQLGTDQARKTATTIIRNYATPCHVVSRETPLIPADGHIACTTITDTGINVNPPPTVLVDCGLELHLWPSSIESRSANGDIHPPKVGLPEKETLYHPLALWSSKEICAQRHARVGRVANGVIIAPKEAGTGPSYQTVLNPVALMFMTLGQRTVLSRVFGVQLPCMCRGRGENPADFFEWSPARVGPASVDIINYRAEAFAFYAVAMEEGGFAKARELLANPLTSLHRTRVAILEYMGVGTSLYPPIDILTADILQNVVALRLLDGSIAYGGLIRWNLIDNRFEVVV